MKRLGRIALLLVLAALAGCGSDRAPEFAVVDIDGRTVASAALGGRPYLVVFWASSCAVCLQEVPDLKALYLELAPAGLELVGVAMEYDPPGRAVALARRLELPWPVLLDTDGDLARGFGGVRYTPTLVLVDASGRIIDSHVGRTDFGELRAHIGRLLGTT